VQQKSIDLLIEIIPDIITMPIQIIMLGSGDNNLERELNNFSRLYPDKISVTIGYDEKLAHLIEAGIDVFLMPSRFEPCGLNQMYSQRYGTIPIVRHTGGLADTVVDAMPETLADNTASGIVFNEAEAGSLEEALKRCLILFDDKKTWEKMQKAGMKKDFSWKNSAKQYLDLYESM
jgi:starch synthase